MRENFTYGSVRGAAGDGSPYRDSTTRKLSCGRLLAERSEPRTEQPMTETGFVPPNPRDKSPRSATL